MVGCDQELRRHTAIKQRDLVWTFVDFHKTVLPAIPFFVVVKSSFILSLKAVERPSVNEIDQHNDADVIPACQAQGLADPFVIEIWPSCN